MYIKLVKVNTKPDSYDIDLSPSGDLLIDDSFDTEIVVSLFSDSRADRSEVSDPPSRRGWHGDLVTTLTGYRLGSKLWLLDQSRLSFELASKVKDSVYQALSVFVRQGHCQRVEVDAYVDSESTIAAEAKLIIDLNVIKSYKVTAWGLSQYV